MAKPIRVLLYYKYVPIENAEQFAADHLAFCKSIGLKGRILVADEGINGTVSGDYETTQKYMDYVHSLPGMEDLWFKIDEEEEQAFKKMITLIATSIHLKLQVLTCHPKSLKTLFWMRILLSLIHVTTMNMTLVTSVVPFVLTFATSVNCHNGAAIIKKSSWISAWLFTVLVVSAVRNSQVGWSVKAIKMLANCMVVS